MVDNLEKAIELCNEAEKSYPAWIKERGEAPLSDFILLNNDGLNPIQLGIAHHLPQQLQLQIKEIFRRIYES